ncbi:MAG: hypothetical protein GC178_15790 [Flavobacteriales bacterium]|nr:hypothetical protein [Flavobacteriales bacterium]
MSSFTPTACYSLSDHTVTFDKKGIQIINSTTGKKVDGASFQDGFDIKVENDDFCFGKITFTSLFNVFVSLKKPSGGFEFNHNATSSNLVGSDELDIPQVTKHIYNLDDCPVRLKGNGDSVSVDCPCNTQGSPCTNSCYKKK